MVASEGTCAALLPDLLSDEEVYAAMQGMVGETDGSAAALRDSYELTAGSDTWSGPAGKY